MTTPWNYRMNYDDFKLWLLVWENIQKDYFYGDIVCHNIKTFSMVWTGYGKNYSFYCYLDIGEMKTTLLEVWKRTNIFNFIENVPPHNLQQK